MSFFILTYFFDFIHNVQTPFRARVAAEGDVEEGEEACWMPLHQRAEVEEAEVEAEEVVARDCCKLPLGCWSFAFSFKV